MNTKKDINLADYIVDPPTPPKHPGGRPPKDPADKVVKCRISMTKAHHAATAGDRAGMIRRALEFYLEKKAKEIEEKIFALLPENPNATATEVIVSKQEIEDYLGGLKAEFSRYANAESKQATENRLRILKNPPSGDKQSKK